MKKPIFLGIHANPGRWNWLLALLPFVILIAAYMYSSHQRLAENPDDKLLPSISQMVDSVDRLAFTPSRRTGEYTMVNDTLVSLQRLAIGLGLAALCGFLWGLNMGIFPGLSGLFNPLTVFLSNIVVPAILPIMLIAFGTEELGKIAFIFVGTIFLITRDIHQQVRALPQAQIIKASTLGATQLAIVYRVVMPQLLPRLLDVVRLSLGAAWIFLIMSEAIAAQEGLGYRIFLVRRYLDMSTIIPYVLWITLLAFMMDFLLRKAVQWLFPWYVAQKKA